MALASLFNIPGSSEELAQWSFAHAAHHYDIISTIFLATGIVLPQYLLDPFDPGDPENLGTWSYLHQQMHEQMDAVLGISGYNLAEVEWQDANQRAAWIQLNAIEHREASNILSLD